MQFFDYHTALTIALGLLLFLAVIRIYQLRRSQPTAEESSSTKNESLGVATLLKHDDIPPLLNELAQRVEAEYGFISAEFTLEQNDVSAQTQSRRITPSGRLIRIDQGMAIRFQWQGQKGASNTNVQIQSVERLTQACVRNIRRIQRYKELANHDPLTGLFNTAYLQLRLREELDRARRFGRSVGFLVLDIDNFKSINDENGHLAGDQVLKLLAGLIVEHVRSIDIVCRYGGDEICVILPDAAESTVKVTLERLQKLIQESASGRSSVGFSVSIGGAISASGELSREELFERADRAMLTAKKRGRNQWFLATGDDTTVSLKDSGK